VIPPFVDTHVHFWDHGEADLHWPYLVPGFPHPRLKDMHRLDAPRFGPDELRAEAGDVPLAAIVHVQSAQEAWPGAETAWLQRLADDGGWPHAIVARVRLAAADAAVFLPTHAAHPRFRGVRDLSAEKDLGGDELLAGWDVLADLGGSVELMVPHERFAEVAGVARHRRDGVVVLGHAGLPVQRDAAYLRAWSAALQVLASEPNVVCKVSALASGSDPDWTVESIRPWVLGCIDAFGPDRCMFASNWPIDRLFGTYERLVDAYDEITSGLTAGERAAVFGETARRVYRIEV
jgi:predicted TIM-barrel fold metal-dependent hydrolase